MNYYNEISQGYEELYKEEQIKKLNFIKLFLEKLNIKIKESYKLLDVGCGTGLTTQFWKSKIKTGIDPAKKLIEKARKKDKKSNYVVAPAENIPFENNSFDIVVSITAIQNFQDIKKGLKEIKRVAKNLVILSFLKKSEKKENILNLIKNTLNIKKITEEDKDIVIICHK
jgi:ubiquinone/menaquinone biosynthesis C-methylase UbiE